MRKGKILGVEFFWDHAEALEAVGLSEQAPSYDIVVTRAQGQRRLRNRRDFHALADDVARGLGSDSVWGEGIRKDPEGGPETSSKRLRPKDVRLGSYRAGSKTFDRSSWGRSCRLQNYRLTGTGMGRGVPVKRRRAWSTGVRDGKIWR